jgi:Bacterial transglutaminase-like cysteine proteinase BTLCP
MFLAASLRASRAPGDRQENACLKTLCNDLHNLVFARCVIGIVSRRFILVRCGVVYVLPACVLRLRVRDGTAHTILNVLTDRDDSVLDNLVSTVLPWTATCYA